jgi:hypothetical protein
MQNASDITHLPPARESKSMGVAAPERKPEQVEAEISAYRTNL